MTWRRDDIEPLAHYFLHFYAAKLSKRLTGMEPELLLQLLRHDWRGNVRELKNVLERAVILADEQALTTDTLPAELQTWATTGTDDGQSLQAMEKRQIRLVLSETGGNKTEAARQLDIGVKTLYRKIQEYGL